MGILENIDSMVLTSNVVGMPFAGADVGGFWKPIWRVVDTLVPSWYLVPIFKPMHTLIQEESHGWQASHTHSILEMQLD